MTTRQGVGNEPRDPLIGNHGVVVFWGGGRGGPASFGFTILVAMEFRGISSHSEVSFGTGSQHPRQ